MATSHSATRELAVQLAHLAEGGLEDLLPAEYNWADVDPVIFGALLERALEPAERRRLGAHYTPREYVARLVKPTLEEPLRAEWALLQSKLAKKKGTAAVALVRGFHTRLSALRVLDPACGSGNFLAVALESMLRLEADVLTALDQLGETQELLHVPGLRVMPSQFLGIEIEPRAAKIAELVLWVGYLQWHYRQSGKTVRVLRDHVRIERRDALLAPWPVADFVIGNPPFLGNKRMRAVLGDAYVEALRAAAPNVQTPPTTFRTGGRTRRSCCAAASWCASGSSRRAASSKPTVSRCCAPTCTASRRCHSCTPCPTTRGSMPAPRPPCAWP